MVEPTGRGRSGARSARDRSALQHPSYGIDVTTSLRVAEWFALHQVYESEPGQWWFQPREPTSTVPRDWPCVYFTTISSLDRERYLVQESAFTQALRPRRQHAVMLHGGWGWHTNQSAHLVVAVAFLHPSFARSDLPDTLSLFPAPSEDPFFDWLIQRRDRAEVNKTPLLKLYENLPAFIEPAT